MPAAIPALLSSLRASSGLLLHLRRPCSAAAAQATAATSAGNDVATVTLRGTVERLLNAGPKHCAFTVRAVVQRPGLDRPMTFQHNVKAFNEVADVANSIAKVGSRVQVVGSLCYERRFRDKPPGVENPFRPFINVDSIQAADN